MAEFEFTENWLGMYRLSWGRIFDHFKPRKVLEIGAYEGRTTCFFIECLPDVPDTEIYCVDTWKGGEEHADVAMADVERRFKNNIGVALEARTGGGVKVVACKGESFPVLNELLVQGHRNTFGLVYVDGGHQAPEVLADALQAYHLTHVGGLIVFDDYLWRHPLGVLHQPKIAIDAFSTIFQDRVSPIYDLPLRQVAFKKIA